MKKKINKKLAICSILSFVLLILFIILIVNVIKKSIVIQQTEIEFYNKNKERLNEAVIETIKKNSDENIKVDGVKSVYYNKDDNTCYVDFSLPTQLFDLFSTYRGIVYSENNTPYLLGVKENKLNKISEDLWRYSKDDNEGFVKRIDYKWFIYNIDF